MSDSGHRGLAGSERPWSNVTGPSGQAELLSLGKAGPSWQGPPAIVVGPSSSCLAVFSTSAVALAGDLAGEQQGLWVAQGPWPAGGRHCAPEVFGLCSAVHSRLHRRRRWAERAVVARPAAGIFTDPHLGERWDPCHHLFLSLLTCRGRPSERRRQVVRESRPTG